MSERGNILSRVREALSVKAEVPGQHGERAGQAVSSRSYLELLPPTGESFEERLAQFRENAGALRAEFDLVNGVEEVRGVLQRMKEAEGWRRVGTHEGELTGRAVDGLGLPVVKTDGGYAVGDLDGCDVGVTECDALVAQTGSVLVTSRSAGGRALSVLPPHHVVLARREQLVRDLPEAFELLQRKYARNYPSMISFITGPSRTGDIERIIVLGAHGPKKLTILVVN